MEDRQVFHTFSIRRPASQCARLSRRNWALVRRVLCCGIDRTMRARLAEAG
ncbi:hypothetical protein ACFWDF_27715 [Streptomyces diastaticus]|uniref:hypothetical protein n=1 Tax=Streptomyces diastaticus TaxID=1956 RepID=UPI0036950188